jgi:hypothetical protein
VTDSSSTPLEKLARFRQLAEDKAAAELRIKSAAAGEAGDVLEEMKLHRDAITAEKALVEAGGALRLDRYAQCLDLEIHASERVSSAESALREAEQAQEASRMRYRAALDAVRIVEKRAVQRLRSDQGRTERIGTDRMTELWLSRRTHDSA